MTDDLIELLQALTAPQARFALLDSYYEGRSALSFLSREAKVALRNFDSVSVNLSRTAVTAVSERCRLSGITGADAWPLFEYSDLDQLQATVHQRALLYGFCPVLVWVDASGKPRATVESPKEVAVVRDPVTREVIRAVKRVATKTETLVWMYYPDRIEFWKARTPSAGNAGFELIDTTPNPLGQVPVVIVGHEDEPSAIADLLTIQDSISKLTLDMLVASEYAGRPRRFATGIELQNKPVVDEAGQPVVDPDTGEVLTVPVNPYPDENRMMISEAAESKFGALPAADLKTFESGIRVLISQAMMVSGLPAHYVGLLQDSVTSADALRAAEAALVSRAESYQRRYGVDWERVGKLLVAIRDDVDPDTVTLRVVFAPADTRSQAQEADYAVKLYGAGILSRTGVLKKLGYTDDEIADELANTRRDAQIGMDVRLGRYAADLSSHKQTPAAA